MMSCLTKCIYLCKLGSLDKVKNNFKSDELFNVYLVQSLRFLQKYLVKDESRSKGSQRTDRDS